MSSEPDELRDVEQHFSQLVAGVEDYAIFTLDREGTVRSWNAGAEKIKGYTAEEIVGHCFTRFYPEEALAKGWPQQELVIAAEAGRFEDEGWRVRKDGTHFWANVVITALRNSQGDVRGFLKITRDLTERKQAEGKLRQSEERFRLLVEGVKDYAIFLLDPEGRIATWNLGAERIKGYAPDEIIGKHFSCFYTSEDVASGKPQRELQTALEKGSVEDEGWRVRKDRSQFWANVTITALYDDERHLRGFAKVTDNVDAALTISALLKAWGHEVQIAFNGPSALETANRFRPEIILLDLGLPGMSGYDVAKHLRAAPSFKGLMIAALTGYGQEEDRRRSFEAGFDYHVTKPPDPGVLETLIASTSTFGDRPFPAGENN